jgi:hypothetical protein
MGRGLNPLEFFEAPPLMPSSVSISDLKVGDKVKITLMKSPHHKQNLVYRSVSTYDCIPSPLSTRPIYEITSIDSYPLQKFNVRALNLIDTSHPNPEMHIDAWVITTDGYVREGEHFGIMCAIDKIEKL